MSGKKMEDGCFDQVHDEVHSEHGTPRQRNGIVAEIEIRYIPASIRYTPA